MWETKWQKARSLQMTLVDLTLPAKKKSDSRYLRKLATHDPLLLLPAASTRCGRQAGVDQQSNSTIC